MTYYSKQTQRTARNVPHQIAVSFMVQTAFGADKAYEVLPTVYPTQRAAMAVCGTFGNKYMSSQPVVASQRYRG
jgi:hypothetical protein